MIKVVVEADLVGYSTICANLEQSLDVKSAAQLNQQIQGIFNAALGVVGAARELTVMSTAGDSAVLVFDTAELAHRFCEALHGKTAEHNKGRTQPLAKRVFRVGAATGDIVMEEKPGGGFDIAGTVIARAVRLEAKAEPGGLLVDEETYSALPSEQRERYGVKVAVQGKRDELFDARLCLLNPEGPQDAAYFAEKAIKRSQSETHKKEFGRDQRREILNLFGRLKSHQFPDLIFLLEIPINRRPADGLTLKAMKTAILKWAEKEQSLDILLDVLRDVTRTGEISRSPEKPIKKPGIKPVGQTHAPCDRPPRAQAGKLFGREAQLDTLLGWLRRGESACVWGPPGFGKTALGAEAVHLLLAEVGGDLVRTPFPGGIVLLDLYRLSDHGTGIWEEISERAWNELADKFDPSVPAGQPARDRAMRACQGHRALVVVEGGEEAPDGRSLAELLSVLGDISARLILTRNKAQAAGSNRLHLEQALSSAEGLALLRKLAAGRAPEAVLKGVVEALGGHPLALTWAGCQLVLAEEPPKKFLRDLRSGKLPGIHEPGYETHTLKWLYDRSARKLTQDAQQVLSAAGLLAAAAFDEGMAEAVLQDISDADSSKDDKRETGIRRRASEALKLLVRHGMLRLAEGGDRWEFIHALAARFAATDRHLAPRTIRGLCRWAIVSLQSAVTDVRSGGDIVNLGEAASQAMSILGCDETGTIGELLANWLLYDAQEAFLTLGLLDLARETLFAIGAWRCNAPADQQRKGFWRREYSAFLLRLGDVQRAQGDLAGALGSYEESLKISEQLAADDPTNIQWQRDLSVSLEKLGDVQKAQGDMAGARTSYEGGRKIRKKLVADDPTNSLWQRDLSVSLNKLGDVQKGQGDLAGARISYGEGWKIREKLATNDPTNTQWQRDLSVSLERLGSVWKAQGDLAEARASHEESRKIREKLAASDPMNAQWQRDLSYVITKLAEIEEKEGNLSKALRWAEASLVIDERLTALDPTNAMWMKDAETSRRLVAFLRSTNAGKRGKPPVNKGHGR